MKLPLLLLLLSGFFVAKAQIVTHVVQRGEDFAQIAARYGVEESALREANEGLGCYAGMRLVIPAGQQDGGAGYALGYASVGQIVDPVGQKMQDAASLMANQKFKNARRILSEVIRDAPSARAYYLRGICHYKRGDWKDAIRDLRTAQSRDDIDASLRSDASEWLAAAEGKRQEQKERRQEIWDSIGGAVLMAGAIAATSYATSQVYAAEAEGSSMAVSSRPHFGSMTDAQFMSYMNQQGQIIMQQSIVQTQLQLQAEYEEARRFNPDLTYEEFMAIRGAAYAAMRQEEQSAASTSDISTTSNSGHSTPAASTKSEKTFCRFCANTRVCDSCHGSGHRTDNMFGTGVSPTVKCGICGGDGKCPHCR